MMIEASRFIDSQLDHLFGAWSQTDFARHNTVSTSNDRFNGAANFLKIDAQAREGFRGNTFTLTHKAKQKMLCSDVVVLEALSFFLGKLHDFPGSLSKSAKSISVVHSCFIPLATRIGSQASAT